MCYQLTFFCEKLQQVKSLSQAHLAKVSQSLLLVADHTRGPLSCKLSDMIVLHSSVLLAPEALMCMLALLQLWCHAITLIAESALEGVARVRSRCSAIGRNAMSSDLQVSGKGFAMLCIVSRPQKQALEGSEATTCLSGFFDSPSQFTTASKTRPGCEAGLQAPPRGCSHAQGPCSSICAGADA